MYVRRTIVAQTLPWAAIRHRHFHNQTAWRNIDDPEWKSGRKALMLVTCPHIGSRSADDIWRMSSTRRGYELKQFRNETTARTWLHPTDFSTFTRQLGQAVVELSIHFLFAWSSSYRAISFRIFALPYRRSMSSRSAEPSRRAKYSNTNDSVEVITQSLIGPCLKNVRMVSR